jgi:hypothetical protein
MAYELPQLPYGYDALEPYIDEQTMQTSRRCTSTTKSTTRPTSLT